MLKGVNRLVAPPLLGVLAEMGHGDEIAVVDANFPAAEMARRLVHMPGLDAPPVLEAILTLLPLDDFVECPAAIMQAPGEQPAVVDAFQALLDAEAGRAVTLERLGRFDFYDRTRTAFAVVATGEGRLYGNILLRKGVIRP